MLRDRTPQKYQGEEIVGGTPYYIEVWYDRSIRIWWTGVYGSHGHLLDLEPKGGLMLHTFCFDASHRDDALRTANELAEALGSHDPLPIWLYRAGKKRRVTYRRGK
jgi:hypothetical protein